MLTRNNPKLRFRADDGNDYPDWEEKKLGEIGFSYTGLSGKSKDDFGFGEYFITYKQVFDFSQININRCELVNITENEHQSIVEFGDVLFTTSSETAKEVGMSSVLLTSDINFKVYLNSFCFGYRYNHFVLLPLFAKYIFRSDNFRNSVIKLAQGSTRYNISKVKMMDIMFCLPDPHEQQKIADCLTSLDDLIAEQSTKLSVLKQHKTGIMQQLFSQKVRFKTEDGSDYPDWEEKRLEKVLNKNSQKNKDCKIQLVQSISNKFGFVNQDEIFKDRVVASDNLSNYYVIEQGMFAYNPSRINVGSLAYKKDNLISVISPLYISFKCTKLAIDYFLLFWLSSQDFIKQMTLSFEGSVRNTLSYDSLIKIKIHLPNIEEQQKIADCLTSLDELIAEQSTKLSALKLHKTGLMQQLFPLALSNKNYI